MHNEIVKGQQMELTHCVLCTDWSEELQRYEQMVNCSPIANHLRVSCELEWDPSKSNQWSCSSDFIQWAIVFSTFVALHALGTVIIYGLIRTVILVLFPNLN